MTKIHGTKNSSFLLFLISRYIYLILTFCFPIRISKTDIRDINHYKLLPWRIYISIDLIYTTPLSPFSPLMYHLYTELSINSLKYAKYEYCTRICLPFANFGKIFHFLQFTGYRKKLKILMLRTFQISTSMFETLK